MKDQLIEVPIRLTSEEIARYREVARAASSDLNTVLCVVLALSVTQPTRPARKRK